MLERMVGKFETVDARFAVVDEHLGALEEKILGRMDKHAAQLLGRFEKQSGQFLRWTIATVLGSIGAIAAGITAAVALGAA